MRQQVLAKHHKRAKITPKSSTIVVYASIFVFIVAVVAVGYKAPQQATGVSNANTVSTESNNNSVDQLIAANIAANAAVTNDLSVKSEVLNNAVTVQLQQEYDLLSEDNTTKPQIIQATANSRSVTTYAVKSGDTINSIASRNGISKETIKWVNDLTSDTLTSGQKLKILPVDGILYKVESGDTISSLASKYKVNTYRLVLYNDLDLGGLKVGSQIILPNATLPNTERPGYTAPVSYLRYTYGYYSNNITYINNPPYSYYNDAVRSYLPNVRGLLRNQGSKGNTMYVGQCTWYVWERRQQLGKPLPSLSLGDAGYWHISLSAYFSINTRPESVGDIIQNTGSPGHVGIVEKINDDGSLLVSDMNYGFRNYAISLRTIPKEQTNGYNYIH